MSYLSNGQNLDDADNQSNHPPLWSDVEESLNLRSGYVQHLSLGVENTQSEYNFLLNSDEMRTLLRECEAHKVIVKYEITKIGNETGVYEAHFLSLTIGSESYHIAEEKKKRKILRRAYEADRGCLIIVFISVIMYPILHLFLKYCTYW